MSYCRMEELIGKRIREIYLSDDQSEILFCTDDGDVGYQTFGDCCSETWFADLVNVPALLDGKVFTIESIALPDYNVEDGRTRQDYDEAYGLKVNTDRGTAKIIYRNSSNGYYGGDIEPIKDTSAVQRDIAILDDYSA